uniref:N-acetyltransferase domain-containing protein n=1 Tax=Macrostomum lignano TaxID=282301 RepID=A0A1I8F4G0_9PLAT
TSGFEFLSDTEKHRFFELWPAKFVNSMLRARRRPAARGLSLELRDCDGRLSAGWKAGGGSPDLRAPATAAFRAPRRSPLLHVGRLHHAGRTCGWCGPLRPAPCQLLSVANLKRCWAAWHSAWLRRQGGFGGGASQQTELHRMLLHTGLEDFGRPPRRRLGRLRAAGPPALRPGGAARSPIIFKMSVAMVTGSLRPARPNQRCSSGRAPRRTSWRPPSWRRSWQPAMTACQLYSRCSAVEHRLMMLAGLLRLLVRGCYGNRPDCGLRPDLPGLYVQSLFVDGAYRRHRVGQSLLATLGRLAASSGFGHLKLLVQRSNAPARELLQTSGVRIPERYGEHRLLRAVAGQVLKLDASGGSPAAARRLSLELRTATAGCRAGWRPGRRAPRRSPTCMWTAASCWPTAAAGAARLRPAALPAAERRQSEAAAGPPGTQPGCVAKAALAGGASQQTELHRMLLHTGLEDLDGRHDGDWVVCALRAPQLCGLAERQVDSNILVACVASWGQARRNRQMLMDGLSGFMVPRPRAAYIRDTCLYTPSYLLLRHAEPRASTLQSLYTRTAPSRSRPVAAGHAGPPRRPPPASVHLKLLVQQQQRASRELLQTRENIGFFELWPPKFITYTLQAESPAAAPPASTWSCGTAAAGCRAIWRLGGAFRPDLRGLRTAACRAPPTWRRFRPSCRPALRPAERGQPPPAFLVGCCLTSACLSAGPLWLEAGRRRDSRLRQLLIKIGLEDSTASELC